MAYNLYIYSAMPKVLKFNKSKGVLDKVYHNILYYNKFELKWNV